MELTNRLKKQFLNPAYKKDAEECIKIYEWLKENHDGRVWSSDWTCLTHVYFPIGSKRVYKLSIIGKKVLEAIK